MNPLFENPYKGLDLSNGGVRLNTMVDRAHYDAFKKIRLTKGTVTIISNILFKKFYSFCEKNKLFDSNNFPEPLAATAFLESLTVNATIINPNERESSTSVAAQPSPRPRKSTRRAGAKTNASNDSGGVDSACEKTP